MKAKFFYITLACCLMYSSVFVYINFILGDGYLSAERAQISKKPEEFVGCILTVDDEIISEMIDDSLKAGKKRFTVSSGLSAWPQTRRITVIGKNYYMHEFLRGNGRIDTMFVREYPNYINQDFGKKKKRR